MHRKMIFYHDFRLLKCIKKLDDSEFIKIAKKKENIQSFTIKNIDDSNIFDILSGSGRRLDLRKNINICSEYYVIFFLDLRGRNIFLNNICS